MGPCADGGLSTSIQLLHLDQPGVEDFIRYLADGHASPRKGLLISHVMRLRTRVLMLWVEIQRGNE